MPLPLYTPSHPSKTTSVPARWVIAIAAGKGGVGKSTLCANLAICLRLQGYRVGALDADIYGPSLRRMIREDRLPVEREGKLQPALAQGIELISLAHFHPSDEAAAFRAPIASKLIDQFLEDVEWHDLDFLLIDLPPGTGDITITLTQKGCIHTSIVISTPQAIATQDVDKCIDLFEQMSVPVFGIVENMAYLDVVDQRLYPFGRGGVQKLADQRGYPVLANLPLCGLLGEACDGGLPFVLQYPHHEISKKLQEVAKKLAEDCKQTITDCAPLQYEWRHF